MEEKKMQEIFKALQGITCLEWTKIRTAVDNYFRKEASTQENKIPMGSLYELVQSYRNSF